MLKTLLLCLLPGSFYSGRRESRFLDSLICDIQKTLVTKRIKFVSQKERHYNKISSIFSPALELQAETQQWVRGELTTGLPSLSLH